MLTFRSLAAGALSEAAAYTAHLLEKTLPDDQMRLSEYYARTSGVDQCLADGMGAVPTVRADLDPRLAKVLGIKAGAALTEKQLGAILSGRRADAGALPGKKQPRRVRTRAGKERFKISGMDLCLSAPKSVSVAWAFAKTEAERNSILQAHRDARDATLRYIEQEIGTRVGAGAGQVAAAAKMAWISIDHFTARATIDITRPDPVTGVMGTELYTLAPNTPGDPQIHSHNIVPNITVTADGRTVAINTMKFHGRSKEFGGVYQAFLASNLREVGIDVDLCDRTLMAKLPAIPDTVCEEFSKRTDDAETAAREVARNKGQDWDTMPVDAKVSMLKGGAKSTRRAKADDLANFSAWFNQASNLGWEHDTAVAAEPQAPLPESERMDAALETSLPLMAGLFEQRAVILGPEARLQAVRGLIKHGIGTTADIGAITKRMVRDGVHQDGQWTRLRYAETEQGVKITTELHVEQETELIDLAHKAAADRSRTLSKAQIAAGVEQAGIVFKGDHGRTQQDAVERLGTAGELGVLIGVAGAGKTTLLKPLIAAWRAEGRDTFGVALAWRQAGELRDAGIERIRLRALQNFLTGVEQGWTKVTANSVVVVDELGQIGTRQLLQLLRLQAEHGFKIVAVGDDRQCQSIEAGAVIDLLRRALGDEAIPEILTTIRQKTEREREIAGKFREATPEAVADAIAMKCEDKTALLSDGGYREAVDAVAQLAMERRQANTPDYTVSVSAPTNADALAIGRAIRAKRKTLNEIGGEEISIEATDSHGSEAYTLQLARGDRIRLFKRTRGKFADSGKTAHVGNNGSVLEIVAVCDDGLEVKGRSGKVAFVDWSALKNDDGQVMLALGECLTIDSAQGLTSDEHIYALPGGSKNVQAFKNYVACSRHRVSSWMLTSKGEEMREIMQRRPLGITDAISESDIWANVARNLGRQDLKENATSFLEKAAATAADTTRTFQAGMRRMEARSAKGKSRTRMKEKAGHKQAVRKAAAILKKTATHIGETTQKAKPMPNRVKISDGEIRAQFSDYLRRAGFDLRGQHPILDGRWRNVPLLGQKSGAKSGGYMGYADDSPIVFFKNHKTGASGDYRPEGEQVPISALEAAMREATQRTRAEQRKREETERHAAKAKTAAYLFGKAEPADPAHPYLVRKNIAPHDLRQLKDNLVVPLTDPSDDKLWSLQFIGPDGQKQFLGGARKAGLVYGIGSAADGDPFAMTEGVATAATAHALLGVPVFAAIDSGNLAPAGEGLRKRYLNSTIAIIADNDFTLPLRDMPLPNVGIEKAAATARAIGAIMAAPHFHGNEAGSDLNDYVALHGISAAEAHIRAQLRERGKVRAAYNHRQPPGR